ncbi:phage tail tape measure protein [Arthrobacter sp. M4]|uniref:phage tail tape measure protein n=1 Tax=Arthrobacter sp. M4 TaxID=218160 RepID=UPI001CDCFA89|nr:phage tail tape measure protein [Arthrobacter sp. M4]MCA4132969.1 phage tail tape measure protein [Arthrobacter sp. M4]
MADRRVKVIFSAEIQNFKKAMEEAAQATQKTKKSSEESSQAADTYLGKLVQSATKNKEAWERTGAVIAGVGAITVAGVGLAVKSFADFDKQMSSVQASTHETSGNMEQLREAAMKAGADTAFSATEAAQGIEELAKAGVSTKDILAGGLQGSLDLAAAGGLGVAESAEIAASALTQFKLSGDKIPHLADLLAAGAGKAQGSVQDLGMALNQSGLVAASTGLTIEETTGSLAAFASAGLTGSDAGTSFKTMLMSLNPNSAAAASKMHELGISAYDAQGNFVGMTKFAGILQNSLKNLSDEQRNAALKTIFGSDAVRAANVLYEQGAEGIQKWTDAVNDAGYASDTARIMQDNLAGDIEKLGGSIDTVFLKSGSGANDFLRGLAQSAEDVVDWIGKIPAPILNAGAAIGGIVGVAALGTGAFLNLTPKVLESMEAFNKLAPAGSRARGALVGVGKAAAGAMTIATLAVVLGKMAEADYMSKIDTGMGRVANVLSDVSHNVPGANAALDTLFKNKEGKDLINDVNSLDSALKRTFHPDAGRQFNDWGENLANMFTGLEGSSHILAGAFDRIDKQMATLVSSGSADSAKKIFETIKTAAEKQGIGIDELKKKFPEYADALQGAEADSKKAAESGDKVAGSIEGVGTAASGSKASAEDIAKALEDVGLAADGSVTDIDKFTQSLFNAGLLNLSASDAAIRYQDAIDKMTESVAKNGTSLDLNTEQGRANQAAFNDLAKAGITAAEAHAKETLASQGSAAAQADLQSSLRTSYDDLVAAAGQLGITGDAADTMARKALGIPKNVNIDAWIADHATQTLDGIKAKADNLDGRVVKTKVETLIETIDRHVQESEYRGDPQLAGLPRGFTGGRVRSLIGFADGGIVPGVAPADPTSDNVLAMVSGQPLMVRSGEWIINESSSRRYDRELAAINAGQFPKLPGYAVGGRAGREYSAQSLGWAPNSPSRGVGDVTVYVTNPFTGEEVQAVVRAVASNEVAAGMNHVATIAGGRSR